MPLLRFLPFYAVLVAKSLASPTGSSFLTDLMLSETTDIVIHDILNAPKDSKGCIGGQNWSKNKSKCICMENSRWNASLSQCQCVSGYNFTLKQNTTLECTKYNATTTLSSHSSSTPVVSQLSNAVADSGATANASPGPGGSGSGPSSKKTGKTHCYQKQVFNAKTGACDCVPGAFKASYAGCYCAIGAIFDAAKNICQCRSGEAIVNHRCVRRPANVTVTSDITVSASSGTSLPTGGEASSGNTINASGVGGSAVASTTTSSSLSKKSTQSASTHGSSTAITSATATMTSLTSSRTGTSSSTSSTSNYTASTSTMAGVNDYGASIPMTTSSSTTIASSSNPSKTASPVAYTSLPSSYSNQGLSVAWDAVSVDILEDMLHDLGIQKLSDFGFGTGSRAVNFVENAISDIGGSSKALSVHAITISSTSTRPTASKSGTTMSNGKMSVQTLSKAHTTSNASVSTAKSTSSTTSTSLLATSTSPTTSTSSTSKTTSISTSSSTSATPTQTLMNPDDFSLAL